MTTTYKVTASSRMGGVENRGWCLDWKGEGWDEPWSADNRKDNDYPATLEEAKSIVDRYQCEFDEFTSLAVDKLTYDDGEVLDEELAVYEIMGTKEG